MTKIAMITGLPGSDIDTYLMNERKIFISERLRAKRAQFERKGMSGPGLKRAMESEKAVSENEIKIYHIGEIMQIEAAKMNLPFNFNYILQLPYENFRMLTRIAWMALRERIMEDDPEIALIKAHASFYDPHSEKYIDGLFNNDLKNFPIDKMCCIIDDEMLIKNRLKQKDQYKNGKFTLRSILEWISIEVKNSEKLFVDLGLKERGEVMQIFSRYLSTTSLYKFIMFDNVPVIYTIYPMTSVAGNRRVEEEIDIGIWIANQYGIVKNPKAGDVATQATGELILGFLNRKKQTEDQKARERHCVIRDLHFLVDKSDIIFGNYPINTYSDGMMAEMKRAHDMTKLVLLKIGGKTKEFASPFRTFPPKYIKMSYDEIEECLQNEGFMPRFRGLMKRWRKEYCNMKR